MDQTQSGSALKHAEHEDWEFVFRQSSWEAETKYKKAGRSVVFRILKTIFANVFRENSGVTDQFQRIYLSQLVYDTFVWKKKSTSIPNFMWEYLCESASVFSFSVFCTVYCVPSNICISFYPRQWKITLKVNTWVVYGKEKSWNDNFFGVYCVKFFVVIWLSFTGFFSLRSDKLFTRTE